VLKKTGVHEMSDPNSNNKYTVPLLRIALLISCYMFRHITAIVKELTLILLKLAGIRKSYNAYANQMY